MERLLNFLMSRPVRANIRANIRTSIRASVEKTIIVMSSLIVLVNFQNCGEVEFSRQFASNTTVTEVSSEIQSTTLFFTQPATNYVNKIDILFVVDTSGSLDAERGVIADNIDQFVNQLPSQINYNIGVLLAHSTLSPYSGKLYKKSYQTEYVLQSSTMSASTIRTQLRAKITDTNSSNASDLPSDNASDGGEEGLASLNNLLAPDNVALAQSQNFLRSDAALAVVFVSDENDICAIYPPSIVRVPDSQYITNNKYPNGIENELYAKERDCAGVTAESVYAKLQQLKNNLLPNLPLQVTGVIYTNPQSTPSHGENEVGYGYTDIINLSGGLAVDIGGDIAAGLAALGDLVGTSLTLITQFHLSHPELVDCPAQVIENSIKVKVDNLTDVPFAFSAKTCDVILLPGNAGGANSNIEIKFDYLK